MPKPPAPTPPPRPTDAELSILHALWRLGPATVRQIHGHLGQVTGYTTVLKLLQIMTEKGLVSRNETERTHVYRARRGEGATQRQLIKDLLGRAFGGSAKALVVQALSARPVPAGELAEIRRLLDSLEGKNL